jgi:hypothetical protein
VEEDEAARERVSRRVQVDVRQGSLLEGHVGKTGPGDGALGSLERRGILIDADHRPGGPDDPGQERSGVADPSGSSSVKTTTAGIHPS